MPDDATPPTGMPHASTAATRIVTSPAPINAQHVANLDIFRAVAALSVCLFHFSSGDFLEPGPIRSALEHARLGVEIFFVISGFVIPWSMYQTRYKHSDAGLF